MQKENAIIQEFPLLDCNIIKKYNSTTAIREDFKKLELLHGVDSFLFQFKMKSESLLVNLLIHTENNSNFRLYIQTSEEPKTKPLLNIIKRLII